MLFAVLHALLVCDSLRNKRRSDIFFAAAEAEENTQSQIVNEAERNAVSLELSCNYVTHGSQHEKAKRDCWQFVPSPLRALVELSEAKRD